MIFHTLKLFNFKNFAEGSLAFVPGINCLVGNNGMGKTNVLDALHYLATGKSAINPVDAANIRHGQEAFAIKAACERNGTSMEVLCAVQAGRRKSIKVNGKEQERLSDHLGLLPVVLIAPDDITLIYDGNEARRRFFDSTISQFDKTYLHHLLRYQRALKQRNSLLKQFAQNGRTDPQMLAPYDHELLTSGRAIYEVRQVFLASFTSRCAELYKQISQEHEQIAIVYESTWHQDQPEQLYHEALPRDLALQRTTVGIHRDAYHFTIDGRPVKRFGSQGQQKSLLVALKLAQFEVLQQQAGTTPVLLLDDIYDKLDNDRIAILLQMVRGGHFGQIFITDAHPERTQHILADNKLPARIFTIKEGQVTESRDYEP